MRRWLWKRPRWWHRRQAVKHTVREWQRRDCERARQGFTPCADIYPGWGLANRCGRCAVLFVAGATEGADG